ncbi:MAG TPA: cupin domain-containing protein [Acidobacteriota bacterium]|nr:cupin domain-containing protein [Acidobacteriota bacterium]
MSTLIEKISLAEKFRLFSAHWEPKIVAELNDFYVKLVRFEGDFVWHSHESEDELFFVFEGEMLMKLREREIAVGPGEMIVIPRGVEHKPVAPREVLAMLFEKKTTVNTGDADSDLKLTELEWI